MNLEKRNSNNARIWILRPQRCISSLSFLPHLPSSICILYFLFCISYFVFLILHFRISSGYFFASLDFSIRGQRKSKFVVLHILQLLFVYESHFVALFFAYYMFLLNDVAFYIMAGGGSSSAIDSVLKSAIFSLPSCIVGSYRAVQPVSSH